MKSRICDLLFECLKIKSATKGKARAHVARIFSDEDEQNSLKRLNDLRLKQLSSWTEAAPSGEISQLAGDLGIKKQEQVNATLTDPAVPPTVAPLPSVPSDSFNRLDAFIAAKQMESAQINPYELES